MFVFHDIFFELLPFGDLVLYELRIKSVSLSRLTKEEMKKYTMVTIDQNVLLRLKKGEESAFEAIYWKYSSWVYNFIYSLLYDSTLTEDLTQTVFLKIWEKRESIDPELGFDSYLFAIARNLVYKETENRLKAELLNDVLQEQSVDMESLEEERIDAELLLDHINNLIEQLPPSRKLIFQLSRNQHLSNKEIATHLSISEKTVETQIYRALRFLKQKLSKDSCLAILLLLMVK